MTSRSSLHQLSQVSSWWQRCSDILSQKRKLYRALILGMVATKPVWRSSLHGGMARALTLTLLACGSTGQLPMSPLKALGRCSDNLLNQAVQRTYICPGVCHFSITVYFVKNLSTYGFNRVNVFSFLNQNYSHTIASCFCAIP
jgi:hypothetical protein